MILNVCIICVYIHKPYIIIYVYMYLEGRKKGDARRESGEYTNRQGNYLLLSRTLHPSLGILCFLVLGV